MKGQFDNSSSQKLKYHKDIKDIRVELTGKNLTKFGGVQLVRNFLRRLKVELWELLDFRLESEERNHLFFMENANCREDRREDFA